ncbi:MAG: hypothetical protein KF729_16295 [Sandaracinaceae bacterium]|nr:hypothetical protein [Sandaracinaceae bacterium]
MTYRDPLDAARARITALEELLESRRFEPDAPGGNGRALSEARAALAEERAEHAAELARAHEDRAGVERRVELLEAELAAERARRDAEVSLLRTKLEEAERMGSSDVSLAEAEETMRRAEAAAQSARLEQRLVTKERPRSASSARRSACCSAAICARSVRTTPRACARSAPSSRSKGTARGAWRAASTRRAARSRRSRRPTCATARG